MRFHRTAWLVLVLLAVLLPVSGKAADRDGDGYSDDAELLVGSNPDNPNSRPIGFVRSAPRVDTLRLVTGAAGTEAGAVFARPQVNVLRMGAGEDGSGTGSVFARPQVNVLRMGAGVQSGYASVIGKPTAYFKRSDADFETSLEPFIAYSRSSSEDWSLATVLGQGGAFVDNVGGGSPADDWLISPVRTVAAGEKIIVNFDYFQQGTDDVREGNGTATTSLRVLVSTNYTSGDPSGATWTDVTPTGLESLASGVWHPSREANILGVSGTNVRIAFRYRSSGSTSGQARTIGIDNIYILDSFFQPPAILTFEADGVEISDGQHLVTEPFLEVTASNFSLAGKAQFLFRRVGDANYTVIGEDTDFSDGAGLLWRLSGIPDGDYQLAARLWSGPNYSEKMNTVKVLYSDTTGPVLSDWKWDNNVFSNGLVVGGSGVVRVAANDGAGVSRVDFYTRPSSGGEERLFGSDASGDDGYTAFWDANQTTADGNFVILAKAYDSLGNLSLDSRTVSLILARPPPPEITSPVNGLVTRQSNVTLLGTGLGNSILAVYQTGRIEPYLVTTRPDGSFSRTLSLREGINTLEVANRNRGGESDRVGISVTLDSSTPGVPLRLTATPQSGGVIRLGWSRPSGSVSGYYVYRATSPFESQAGATRLTGEIFKETLYDDTPAADDRYYYAVSTVNVAGVEGALSNVVSAVRDTSSPKVLDARYSSSGKFDPVSGRFGVGSVQVYLELSEPVQASPFFSVTPAGGNPLVVSLEKFDSVNYLGSFQIAAGTPTGVAVATVAMRDLAGNRGSEIISGTSITIDTAPPNVIALEVLPGASIKNDPNAPAVVTIRATMDSKLKEGTVPQFSYTLSNTALTPVSISGFTVDAEDPMVWTGSFALPATAGQTTEKLHLLFSASDDLDNAGGVIVPEHDFEIYQGDLPGLDSPIGLTAKGVPAGKIALEWKSVEGAADYEIYRKSASGPQFAVVGTSGGALSYLDLPETDGAYEYAVGAVRSDQGLTSVSERSNTANAISDRVAPDSPSNLQLQLIGRGIQATWLPPNGLLITDRFVVYRENPAGTEQQVAGSDIDKLIAIDSKPDLSHPYYRVATLDSVGNESTPTARVYLNAALLPVQDLNVIYPVGDFPTITWTSASSTVAGYWVYQGVPPQQSKLNGGKLVAGNSYLDTGYNPQGDRTYTVVSVDQNGVESPGHSIVLPRISALSSSGNLIRRGEMNRLLFDVRNDSDKPVDNAHVSLTISGNSFISGSFSLLAGATKQVGVVVPGSAVSSANSAAVTRDLVIVPNPGEKVLIRRFEQIAVVDGGLQLDLIPGDFQVGGFGSAKFRLVNTSAEPIEIITATGRGAQASPDVRFTLLDSGGNEIATQAFKSTTGLEVVSLQNGDSVVRLPAGYEYFSPDTQISIPSGVSTSLQLLLDIDRVFYHRGEADEVVLTGLSARTDVVAGLTSYYGEITSISPAVSNGNQDVVISGRAVARESGEAKPDARLILHLVKDGFDRAFDVITDANGAFSYTFRPFEAEAGGTYYARAVHPNTSNRNSQASFVIQKLLVSPNSGNLRSAWNQAQTITVTATTSEGLSLNHVRLVYLAEDQADGVFPVGITVEPILSADVLGPKASAPLSAKITAVESPTSTGSIVLRVVSDESGANGWQKIKIDYEFGAGSPSLTASPGFVNTGVNPASSVTESVLVRNVGLATAKTLNFKLLNLDGSDAPQWASVTSGGAPDLIVGGEMSVDVLLQPNSTVAPGDYFFILRGQSENGADFDVSVHAAVTESGEGGVAFKVRDAFSGTVNSEGDLVEGVNGARIELQNEKVLSIQQSVLTDSKGKVTVTGLPSGSYTYRVNSDKHLTSSGRFWIRPGTTVDQAVALQYSPITVEWEVVPITIKDHYSLVLNTTFETNVPAPVVVLDPPVINLPRMAKGEVLTGSFTATNHGLIRADNLNIGVPNSDSTFRYEFLSGIPSSLGAGESVTVAYRVTALKDFGKTSRTQAVAPSPIAEASFSRSSADSASPVDPSADEVGECVDTFQLVPVTFSFICFNGLEFDATVLLPFFGSYGDCSDDPGEAVDWTSNSGGGSSTGSVGANYNWLIPIGAALGEFWGQFPTPPRETGGGEEGRPEYTPQPQPDPLCYPVLKYGSPLFTFGVPREFLTDVGCSVNTMNRQFEDDIVDMSVRVPGHSGVSVDVGRQAREGEWLFFPKMKFVTDEQTNDETYLEVEWQDFRFFQADHHRKKFRSGTTAVEINYDDPIQHAKLTFLDNRWITFDENGNIRAEGRNGVTYYTADYDSSGRRTQVRQGAAILLRYEWQGDLLSAVEDREQNRVEYTYTAGWLTKVVGPDEAETRYEYDTYKRLVKITDSTGKSHSIAYRTNSFDASALAAGASVDAEVMSVLDQDGRGSYFEFGFNSDSGDRYGMTRSTDGVVDEKWFYEDGALREWKRNGNLVKRVNKIVNETTVESEEFYTFSFSGSYFNGRSRVTVFITVTIPYPAAIWRAQTLEITDGSENTWTEDYNALGQLETVINPDGSSRENEYDQDTHLLVSSIDENLVEATYSYDDLRKNLSEEIVAAGTPVEHHVKRTYDAQDRPLSITWKGDAQTPDKITRFEYDTAGELKKLINPLGDEHQILTRSTSGDVLTQRDARNDEWAFSYDKRHRVETTTDPENKVTQFEFDAFNNVTGITAPSLRKVTLDYDINNSLVKTTDSGGNVNRNEYDADGRLAKSIDASGKSIFYEYDSLGRTSVVRDAVGNETIYHYDPAKAEGVPVSITFPTFTRSIQYNERKQVTESVDTLPGGQTVTTRNTYSPTGALLSMVDGEGRSTVYERDELDRTTSITREGSGTSYLAYDVQDNVISFTNPNGKIWRYRYDAAGQLKEEETPLGKITGFEYDEVGNLVTITRPDGSEVKRTFDSQHRVLTVKQFAVGAATPHKSVSYTHDDDGRVTGYSDGVTTATYVYDGAGRMTSETVEYGAFSTTNSYEYNANGTLASYTSPAGTVSRYAYDAANRPLGMSVAGVGEFSVNGYLVNAVTKMTLPGGTTQNFTRDAYFRPTRIQSADSRDNGLLDLNLGYSPLGNVTTRNDGSGARTLAYDAARRLTQGISSSYTYDSNSNRLTDSAAGAGIWQYDDDDRLLDDGRNSYVYDNNGALTTKTTPLGSWNYSYDEEGRLVQVTKGSDDISYYYAPNGRRLSKTINGVTTYYAYSALGLCAEYNAGGGLIREYGYSPVAGGGAAPAYVKSSGGLYFYHSDQIGTPLLLTDAGGNVVWKAVYDDFGKANVSVNTVENNFRFPGQYFDAETGLHYNQNRYYDPENGRYLSKDPIRDGDNFYAYAGSNPLAFTDPEGLRAVHEVLGLAGMIPVFGVIPDLLDAAFYALQGDFGNAAWSLGFAIPFIGDAARGAKYVGKYGDDVIDLADSGRKGLARSGEISADSAYRLLTKNGFSPDKARDYIDSFDGPLTARIVEKGEDFLRYTDRATSTGNFLTKKQFDAPSSAVDGLYLRPYGNNASLRKR